MTMILTLYDHSGAYSYFKQLVGFRTIPNIHNGNFCKKVKSGYLFSLKYLLEMFESVLNLRIKLLKVSN